MSYPGNYQQPPPQQYGHYQQPPANASQPWADPHKSSSASSDAPPPYQQPAYNAANPPPNYPPQSNNQPVNQSGYPPNNQQGYNQPAYPPNNQSYPPPGQAAYPPNNQPNYPPHAGYGPPPSNYPPPNQAAYAPGQAAYPPPNQAAYPPPNQSYPPPGQAAYPPPNQSTSHNAGAMKMERFQQICRQYEISDFFASKLRSLAGFEIVIVADDSGSMTAPIMSATTASSPFAPPHTRWDELKHTCSLIVSIAGLFDDNGLDVYFLNRPPVTGVRDPSQLTNVFAQPPAGFTPTSAALNAVFQAKRTVMAEKKLLVVLLTDGQPTDTAGNIDVRGLEGLLMNRPPQSYVTIVACTDDHSVMGYLNGWDKSIPRVDVVDDYLSEKREIHGARGPQFAFSYGDYIVKLLLGTIDPVMDRLDEKHSAPYQMAPTHAPGYGGHSYGQPQYAQPQYAQPMNMQAAYNMPPTNAGQWGGYY